MTSNGAQRNPRVGIWHSRSIKSDNSAAINGKSFTSGSSYTRPPPRLYEQEVLHCKPFLLPKFFLGKMVQENHAIQIEIVSTLLNLKLAVKSTNPSSNWSFHFRFLQDQLTLITTNENDPLSSNISRSSSYNDKGTKTMKSNLKEPFLKAQIGPTILATSASTQPISTK